MKINGLATRRAALLGATGAAGCAALSRHPAPAPRGSAGRAEYFLPFTDVLSLRSRVNDVRYALYVRRPPAYDSSDERVPLIVTLDADYSFAIAANQLEHLADRTNQAPRALLVAIAVEGAYPDRDLYRAARTRDYTPVFVATGGYGPEFQAVSGGGPAFLRIVEEEILPRIEERYRLQAGARTLVGHSYGGLFAAWTLQTRPDLFDRYLLVSPSLWYADQLVLRTEDVLRNVRLSRPTRVYVGVGALEEQPGNDRPMVSQALQFARMLSDRGDPSLHVEARVFEDETHASIFPAAFSTGIRHLFGPSAGS